MSYLKERTQKEEKLKVIYASHNAYWSTIKRLARQDENLECETIGLGLNYLDRLNITNVDLIIYYGSELYEDHILESLLSLAINESSKYQKSVTLSYSFLIPKHERLDDNIKEQMHTIVVRNGEQATSQDTFYSDLTPTNILEETIKIHDELSLSEKRV